MRTNHGISIQQEEVTNILSEMINSYNDDELTELLCECEVILQTNDIYLKKHNQHGFKRLFNLITGAERKSKCRILGNFQLLHSITLQIQKNILLKFHDLSLLISKINEKYEKETYSMQYCINFLLQKINDQKKFINQTNIRIDLLEWYNFYLEDYTSYSDVKKVLQIVSDIYAITKGKCDVDYQIINAAIKKLQLTDIKISPDNFANEIIQDSSYLLPLYIKDELDYNNKQSPISYYGNIIYYTHGFINFQNEWGTSVVQKNDLLSFCLPLLKKFIMENHMTAEPASEICIQLLKDMNSMHFQFEQQLEESKKRYKEIERTENKHIEEQKEDYKRKGGTYKKTEQKYNNTYSKKKDLNSPIEEGENKYSMFMLSPSNVIECSLNAYVEYPIQPTNDYSIDKREMQHIQKQISDFSPAILVKSDGICKDELAIENCNIPIISLADFYFCLLYKNQINKYIALVDYYKHFLYVSCYHIDQTGKINKTEPFTIKYNKTKNTIINAIIHSEIFLNAPKDDIILYRIFKTDKYINKKLEYLNIPFIDTEWKHSLKNTNTLKPIIDFLYDFYYCYYHKW